MSEFFQGFIPAHRRPAQGTLAFAAVLSIAAFGIAGCGSSYRPSLTPITPTGPPPQPTSQAFIVSAPSALVPGIATLVDYSGDTVMATASIGPGPVTFALNSGGTSAWSLNSDGTLTNIPTQPSTLQAKNIQYSTLTPIAAGAADPVVALFSTATALFALDVTPNQFNQSSLDLLSGSPSAFKLTIPVDQTPVTMVGVSGSSRYYTISQLIPYLTPFTLNGTSVDGGAACNINAHAVGVNGVADAVENSFNTVSAHIGLGVCPVYAVGSSDGRRVFVMNRGSDTISVINSQNNAIDYPCPPVNQNGQAVNCPVNGLIQLPKGSGPVYAEYNIITNQLVVANYEGNTISIIDVSLDEYGNDSSTFGTTFTVPVGKNPASVTVLTDGSRAYVANQSDGTISIVNMASHTVAKTLSVTGHPRTVVSTKNSLYGKVYVASPDSPFVSIIRTDQDILSTTVLVQGNSIDVRVTSPDTSSANVNTVSRLPAAGQPCYLPPSSFTSAGAALTVANCKVQDPSLFTVTNPD